MVKGSPARDVRHVGFECGVVDLSSAPCRRRLSTLRVGGLGQDLEQWGLCQTLSRAEQGPQGCDAQAADRLEGESPRRDGPPGRHLPVTALLTLRQYEWIHELIGAMSGLRCSASHVVRLALNDLRERHWSPKNLEAALRRQVWRELESQRVQPGEESALVDGARVQSYRRTRIVLTERQYVWTQAVVSAMAGLRGSASHVIRLALDDLRERHSSAKSVESALRRHVWRELEASPGRNSGTLPVRRERARGGGGRGPQHPPAKRGGLVRVVLVDHHALVRAGLRASLDETADLSVVGELSNGDAALGFIDHQPADVVLMELSMPGTDGIAAIRAIVEAHPEVKVVAFPTFSDRELVLAAVEAGAVSFLFKDAVPDELVTAIRAAARGESPVALRAALALLAARAGKEPLTSLTNREREVLTLVGRGFANKQIARRLGISEKTVKTHLGHTFQRIGVSDRTQAALWAERNGLLDGS